MADDLRIVEDDLRGPEIVALLEQHVAGMYATSPPDSVHTLPLESLLLDSVIVWSAWRGDALAGCGALQEIDSERGEIKSMRTASAFLGQGIGSAILRHIIQVARSRGYRTLLLETGSGKGFEAAHSLYRKFGFHYRGPFANYVEDSFSRFMQLDLVGEAND